VPISSTGCAASSSTPTTTSCAPIPRGTPDPKKPAETFTVILGDIATSKPAYLRDPRKSYTLDGYAKYKTDNAARKATVFVGANDGMLHAFDAGNGKERWAYVPRITMKKLYVQAGTTYGTNHQYTVDGAPELGDVQIDGSWRSVLVGGLNAGGRGFYALDVTDPANPKALWELCADSTVCSGINYDADLGLSFGNPQFGTWRDAGGTTKLGGVPDFGLQQRARHRKRQHGRRQGLPVRRRHRHRPRAEQDQHHGRQHGDTRPVLPASRRSRRIRRPIRW
jgi:hypothetical protein